MSIDLNTQGTIMWFDDFGVGDNPYSFLSNFYVSPFRLHQNDGLLWLSGEHAYQAAKFWGTDKDHWEAIIAAQDPAEAKAMGNSRQHVLRDDWESVKYDVMAYVIRGKFAPDTVLSDRLLGTGDTLLVEGTYWNDQIWGVDLSQPTRPGRNWLGTLLMARRAELRAHALFPTHDAGINTKRDNIRFSLGAPS